MIDIKRTNNDCVGCGACMNICAQNAITLKSDSEGFLFPEINEDICIDCECCDKVCQLTADESVKIKPAYPQSFYALINKNSVHLKASSSGGAFLAIAKYVFSVGGVVAGCSFDEKLTAQHIITYTLEECIKKLCGSKYVQSDTKNIFKEIESVLETNRLVLFSGTPCQVEALYCFLGGKPENLITVDLICHGVPSPLLWEKHIEYMQKKIGTPIHTYRFRGKEKKGWALYYYYYYYYGEKNKCKHGPAVLDRYYQDFLLCENYRESCYRCRYSNLDRVADITIGDFWGVEKHLDLDIRNGISILIVNSVKGAKILNTIRNDHTLIEVNREEVIEDNHNLVSPSKRPMIRGEYYKNAYKSIETWEKSYTKSKNWRISKVKSLIPMGIKQFIKRWE